MVIFDCLAVFFSIAVMIWLAIYFCIGMRHYIAIDFFLHFFFIDCNEPILFRHAFVFAQVQYLQYFVVSVLVF